jgi:general stress protein 26
MNLTELPYKELMEHISEVLKKREWGHLATSANDFVRVGYMRIVSDGYLVWCYTDKRSRKYQQLQVNQNIAIGDKDLQIEGIANIRGHPLDEENSAFIQAYKENQPENYKRTANRQFLPDRTEFRVIEIVPSRITHYQVGSTPEENVFLILDTVEKKAYRLKGKKIFETKAYKSGLR